MSIRRALTFAWCMALAYLRIALSMTLIFAGLIGLAVLAMVAVTLVWQSLSGMGGVAETFRFIIQLMAFVAIIFSVFFSVGLVWNVIGVAVEMLFAPHELSVKDLRITIPQRLRLYNRSGLPVFVMMLIWLAGSTVVAVLCFGAFMFLIGFVTGEVATNAWRRIVDWYELKGKFVKNIKRKKNIPAADKPKIETAETYAAEMVVAEDDVARLRKSR